MTWSIRTERRIRPSARHDEANGARTAERVRVPGVAGHGVRAERAASLLAQRRAVLLRNVLLEVEGPPVAAVGDAGRGRLDVEVHRVAPTVAAPSRERVDAEGDDPLAV